MPKKYSDFIPKDQDGAKTWYQFEIDNIDVEGPLIGMTVPQITAYKVLCQNQIDDLNRISAAKAELASAVEAVKTNSKVNNGGLRKAVKLAKTNILYTPAGGKALKVVDTHVTLDFEFYKPTFENFVFKGYVRLKFDFNGLESMNIYRRMTGTLDWGKPYANVQHSPYDDHGLIFVPALPLQPATSEARDYMIIGVYNDVEVGLPSAVHPVVFGG